MVLTYAWLESVCQLIKYLPEFWGWGAMVGKLMIKKVVGCRCLGCMMRIVAIRGCLTVLSIIFKWVLVVRGSFADWIDLKRKGSQLSWGSLFWLAQRGQLGSLGLMSWRSRLLIFRCSYYKSWLTFLLSNWLESHHTAWLSSKNVRFLWSRFWLRGKFLNKRGKFCFDLLYLDYSL